MAFSTGIQSKRGLSAVSMLDKRIIGNSFIDVYDQAGIGDVMGLLPNGYEAVSQPIFHDFYNSDLFVKLDTTGATITGSGTSQVSGVTLTAATSGYARKGLKVQFPNGKVGQIQSVTTASSQDTLVIKSTDGSNLTLAAGMILTPLTVLVGEGSTQVESINSTPTRIYNLIEQARENYKMTDVQIQSDVEVEFEGSSYIWNQQIAEAFLRFKAAVNANHIGGTISAAKYEDAVVALADPNGGGAQQTSRGLNQYVETYGVLDSITTLGTPVIADFEDFGNLLTAARAPRNYVGYCSNAVAMKFSIWAKGLNTSGVTSGRLSLDGKELDFNAEKLAFGKYALQVAALPILDNGILLSQSDIVKSMFWVPEGQATTQDGKRKPYMSIKYMKQVVSGNIGNDIYSEWDTGALARGGATSDEMVRRTHWHTAQALHVIAPHHFGRQKFIA